MLEMKDSGIEWVGNIPKHWEFDKAKYHFTNNKYVVGIKSVDYDRLALTLKGVIHRDKEDNEGLQPNDFNTYQLLKAGELVFKLIDLQNVSTSRIGLAHDTGIVSPAYIILSANKSINPAFAEKFFLMMWHREIFNALGDAGVRSSLNAGDLLNVRIPVPPIEEQNRIADFLDNKCAEIDAISAEIQEQIETLEEYKRSVITEAVTKGLDPNVEMKDSGIEYIGKIPKSWTVKRLKYILNERNERSNTGNEELLSVSQYKGVIPSNELSQRTMQANSLIGYKKVYKNDLVFNKLNPSLARFGASNYEGITSPDFAVYIVDECCHSKFLQHVLKSSLYVTKIKSMSIGVGDGFTRLYTPQLYEFCVAIPSREVVDKIIAYIENFSFEIDGAIEDKQKQLEVLEEYKKTLIYEYVTGKKEVA